ncbi:unnamed protein product, partial [Brenthis ino]
MVDIATSKQDNAVTVTDVYELLQFLNPDYLGGVVTSIDGCTSLEKQYHLRFFLRQLQPELPKFAGVHRHCSQVARHDLDTVMLTLHFVVGSVNSTNSRNET